MRRLTGACVFVLQNADLGNSYYKKAQIFFACGGQKVLSKIGFNMSLVALTVGRAQMCLSHWAGRYESRAQT